MDLKNPGFLTKKPGFRVSKIGEKPGRKTRFFGFGETRVGHTKALLVQVVPIFRWVPEFYALAELLLPGPCMVAHAVHRAS